MFKLLTGYYIYIETDAPRIAGDRARLIAPKQNPTGGRCVTFWYHMYGPHVDRLNVYLRQTLDKLIFTKYGTQGNQWMKGELEIQTNDPWSVSVSLRSHIPLCNLLAYDVTSEWKKNERFRRMMRGWQVLA